MFISKYELSLLRRSNEFLRQYIDKTFSICSRDNERIIKLENIVSSLCEIKSRKDKKDKWEKAEPKEPTI